MRINKFGKWELMGLINPRPVSIEFNNVVVPHAITDRATYTVTIGKAAVLKSVSLSVMRDTAAAANGLVEAEVVHITGNGEEVVVSKLTFELNTVDLFHEVGLSAKIPLNGIDQLVIRTTDASTGGAIAYDLFVLVVEGDIPSAV